jgi:rubrerythrin
MDNKILRCLRCNYNWKRRGKKIPKFCPSCHNPNWNKKKDMDIISFITG